MSVHTAQGLRAAGAVCLWGLGATLLVCRIAAGHVQLNAPNGGVNQSFEAGSVQTIQWQVQVAHNTDDWDLWYSSESEEGPWIEIAQDLPKGNIDEGAEHSFDWTVPALNVPQAWVRVRQDNAGMDYYDVSDESFSIVAPLGGGDFTGDGRIDSRDLAAWQRGFGTAPVLPANGDADLDLDADGADFLDWQAQYSGAALGVNSPSAAVVPEPVATALLLVGMLILLGWRRESQ